VPVKFTHVDPLPAAVGSPYESSYVYVGNNPLMSVDPTGLCRQTTTTSSPTQSAVPDRLALTAPGGPQFDCDSVQSH
jgi:hypothetical protein